MSFMIVKKGGVKKEIGKVINVTNLNLCERFTLYETLMFCAKFCLEL